MGLPNSQFEKQILSFDSIYSEGLLADYTWIQAENQYTQTHFLGIEDQLVLAVFPVNLFPETVRLKEYFYCFSFQACRLFTSLLRLC